MRKIAVIIVMFLSMFVITGCGQEMDVTIWNASGIYAYGQQWTAVVAHWDNGGNRNLFAETSANSEEELDSTNSLSFKATENSTLTVSCNGQYYVADSAGNTSVTVFSTEASTQVLYGGLMDPGHWYAAAYKNSVIIYKK